MDNEIKSWLFDVLNAIMEIDSFLLKSLKNFQFIKTIFEQGELLKEMLKL